MVNASPLIGKEMEVELTIFVVLYHDVQVIPSAYVFHYVFQGNIVVVEVAVAPV